MAHSTNRSLKFKLMAICIGLTVALGGMAIVGVNYLSNMQGASRLKAFDAWSAALEDGLTAQFYERYGDVQAFAVSPAIRAPDRASVVASLNGFAALYRIYDLILVVDLRGNLVAVNSRAPDGKRIASEALYQRSYADAPWFKAVIGGRTSDEVSKGLAGTYVEEIGDDALVSQVYGGKRQGNSFSSAIRDADGKIIGVVSNRTQAWYQVAFTNAYELVKATNLPGTVMMLLNRSGRIMYEFGSTAAVNSARTNLVVDFFAQTSAGVTDYRVALADDGSEQAVAFRPVGGPKFTSSLNWYLTTQDSLAEVVAQDAGVKKTFFVLIGVTLVICAGLSYAFSVSLSRQLTALAQQLSANTVEVSSAAVDILSSSTELSQAAAEQAAAIQQTAAAIDEVSAMAKKSADNASLSQQTSINTRQAAEKGQEAAQEMIRAINAISESNGAINVQVEDGNRQISDIVKVIGEIGTKTKVINDIVFQTKLLSFNASVEAARAGEHGKGFAVVAEEVGNLAQMSGNAAKEISAMLDSSIQKVESIVSQTRSRVESIMATGKTRVETGTRVAGACGETLIKLLGLVQEVEGMVAEIASASAEQAQGVTEINKAMNSLDQVTHKNSAVAQRAAQDSEKLTQQSTEMRQSIAALSVLVQGTDAPAAQGEGGTAGHLGAPDKARRVPAAVAPKASTGGVSRVVVKPAPQPLSKKHSGPRSPATGAVTAAATGAVSTSRLKPAPRAHHLEAAGPPSMDDPRFKDV